MRWCKDTGVRKTQVDRRHLSVPCPTLYTACLAGKQCRGAAIAANTLVFCQTVMAYIALAYIVMAYTVMAHNLVF